MKKIQNLIWLLLIHKLGYYGVTSLSRGNLKNFFHARNPGNKYEYTKLNSHAPVLRGVPVAEYGDATARRSVAYLVPFHRAGLW